MKIIDVHTLNKRHFVVFEASPQNIEIELSPEQYEQVLKTNEWKDTPSIFDHCYTPLHSVENDIEEAVTIIYGTLDLLGFLDESKTTIRPEFTEKDKSKQQPIIPYIVDNLMRIGGIAADMNSSHPGRRQRAIVEMAKKMWMVDNVDAMVTKYSKYNKLKEKMAEIEAQYNGIGKQASGNE